MNKKYNKLYKLVLHNLCSSMRTVSKQLVYVHRVQTYHYTTITPISELSLVQTSLSRQPLSHFILFVLKRAKKDNTNPILAYLSCQSLHKVYILLVQIVEIEQWVQFLSTSRYKNLNCRREYSNLLCGCRSSTPRSGRSMNSAPATVQMVSTFDA